MLYFITNATWQKRRIPSYFFDICSDKLGSWIAEETEESRPRRARPGGAGQRRAAPVGFGNKASGSAPPQHPAHTTSVPRLYSGSLWSYHVPVWICGSPEVLWFHRYLSMLHSTMPRGPFDFLNNSSSSLTGRKYIITVTWDTCSQLQPHS